MNNYNIKASSHTRKIINELYGLCIAANNDDDFIVFHNVAGYVNTISIQIAERSFNNVFFDEEFYYKGNLFDRDTFNDKIKLCKAELMKIINPQ